jgi:hypothetical protein
VVPHFFLQPDLDQAADGFGNGRCRSRTLTVSQLSRQAKENPVRGAGFERGKFSGAHRRSCASAAREGYFHRLPLLSARNRTQNNLRGVLPMEHPESRNVLVSKETASA